MRTDKSHSADCYCRILKEGFGSVGTVDDDDKWLEKNRNVLFHVTPKFDRNFSSSPCSIVADRNVICVQVLSKYGHKFANAWMDMWEARLCQVT